MSEACSIKTRETYSSMSEESIQKLEAEIARLEKAYGTDSRGASKEMKEIIGNFVADEKYSAVNIIANKIKNERAKRKIIVKVANNIDEINE